MLMLPAPQGPFVVVIQSHGEAPKGVSVPTLQEASRICRAFIVDDEIQAADWVGAKVLTEENKVWVAEICYTGRAWVPETTSGEMEFNLEGGNE